MANEALPPTEPATRGWPRCWSRPLQAEERLLKESGGLLMHQTKVSGLRVAAAMDHQVEGPDRTTIATEGYEDWLAPPSAACSNPARSSP